MHDPAQIAQPIQQGVDVCFAIGPLDDVVGDRDYVEECEDSHVDGMAEQVSLVIVSEVFFLVLQSTYLKPSKATEADPA